MFLHKINKIKIIAMAAIIGSFSSCDEFLEVTPESIVTTPSFYQNNNDLQSALIGAYSRFSQAYASKHVNWGEFRSDNIAPFNENGGSSSIINSQLSGSDNVLRWNVVYSTIDFVNRIINEGEKIEGFDANIVGQAYAIRAKIYFDLVRVWGNIPVFTESVTDVEDASRSQTPASDVIDNVIIPDMLRAESLLSTPASDFAFSKSSVYALQGEVYLWIGENQLAKEAFESLIAGNTHSLVTTPQAWQNLFLNQPRANADTPVAPGKVQTGSELIFSLSYLLGSTTPSSGLALAYSAGGKNNVMSSDLELKWRQRFPLDTLWNTLYPDTPPVFTETLTATDGTDSIAPLYGDWRLFATREGGSFTVGEGSEDIQEARIFKWHKDSRGVAPRNDDTNLVIYRYADIILMLAEAELKLNNPTQALALINQVRTARQLPLVTAGRFSAVRVENEGDVVTQQDFEEARLNFLLDERRFELVGEGKRWWDLVRNNKAIEILNPIFEAKDLPESTRLTQARLLWPIFDQHLIENDKLRQNPEW